MYELAKRLFPICRSITGDGVRQTLQIIKEHLPDLNIYEVPSGTRAFDWTVPDEWNIRDAYILTPDGRKIADFKKHNLHVVGYSEPVERDISLAELQTHLHSRPDLPDAIPYVTSYYKRDWGFCLSHREREALPNGTYHVVIDSTLEPGHMTYADLIIPGELRNEVLLSTYICHPSMGNNEVSGPVVTTFLARWLKEQRRKFTYRIVFIPETIGSIVYISRNDLSRVVAGFNVTCVGDNRFYSFLPSRAGNTISDKVAFHVLRHTAPFRKYSFLDRGSDERQYCSPGVDLPIASVMRTKYGEYPEYHTSLDDLSLISQEGLEGGFTALRRCLEVIEADRRYRAVNLCEPQMGKYDLYSQSGTGCADTKTRMDILAYCDGEHSVLDIAEIINRPAWELEPYINELKAHGLIR